MELNSRQANLRLTGRYRERCEKAEIAKTPVNYYSGTTPFRPLFWIIFCRSTRHVARAAGPQCDSWRPRKRVLFFVEACKAETNPRLYRPHRLRPYRPEEKILLGAYLGLGPPAQAIALRAFSPKKGERPCSLRLNPVRAQLRNKSCMLISYSIQNR